jgi:membrane protein YqaA with SNARE-associated domain
MILDAFVPLFCRLHTFLDSKPWQPVCTKFAVRRFLAFFLQLGPAGPLLLGIADSSFLFLPFGNDLLLVVLLARDWRLFPAYVPMAAVGSTIGVFLLDVVCRKGGEEGLKRMLKPKRFEYMKSQMEKRAGVAISVACIAPPPFPFTIVIVAASAFAYPRARLLIVVLLMRLARFSLIGLAAVKFGRQILQIARSPAFTWAMFVFITICAIGSTISVIGWIKRSRHPPTAA